MTNKARDHILARLRSHSTPTMAAPIRSEAIPDEPWSQAESLQRFTERLHAVRAEVHRAERSTWPEVLRAVCREKGVLNLLLSRQTPWGVEIHQDSSGLPPLRSYDAPIEDWKYDLFHDIDAALTSTLGGIAETGSLILWPNRDEPRLMSLVPPVHIAILEIDKLYTTFAAAVAAQGWTTQGMPANALLISGPSKSADIEQTLAYGVHGPKSLVVIVVG